jgi:hypothetical protein
MCSKYVTFYANRERVKEMWQPEESYGMALADFKEFMQNKRLRLSNRLQHALTTVYSILVHCGNSLDQRERGRGKGMKGISMRLANTFCVPDLQSGSRYYGDDDTRETFSCRGNPQSRATLKDGFCAVKQMKLTQIREFPYFHAGTDPAVRFRFVPALAHVTIPS